MFYTSLHCVNKTSHTVNHYNPEQGGIETLVIRLTFCAWRSTHVLVSSILTQMKTFADVPDVSNRFSRIENVFFRFSVGCQYHLN